MSFSVRLSSGTHLVRKGTAFLFFRLGRDLYGGGIVTIIMMIDGVFEKGALIARRGNPDYFFKFVIELILVFKAHLQGDLLNGQIGVAQ